MSTEAVTWALDEAPDVPSHCVGTLVALAEKARSDGTNACPSQATLARRTRKSDRQVRTDLATLEDRELIERSLDQSAVEHIPADHRPVVWNLRMDRKSTSARAVPSAGSTASEGPAVQRPRDRKSTSAEPRTNPRTNPKALPAARLRAGSSEQLIIERLRCTPAVAKQFAEVVAARMAGPIRSMDAVIRHFDACGDLDDLVAAAQAKAAEEANHEDHVKREAAITNCVGLCDYRGWRIDADAVKCDHVLTQIHTQRQPALPAWCGKCDQETRRRDVEVAGRTVGALCSSCHPDAVRAAA